MKMSAEEKSPVRLLDYPFDAHALLRKKRAIRRALAEAPGLLEKKIAILGGSTTAEIRDLLELFLLRDGIRPIFYESEYNRYFEEVAFDDEGLRQFAPELIYLHTTHRNLSGWPRLEDDAGEVERRLEEEFARLRALWDAIAARYGCPIIQNNFELPPHRGLGNLDASHPAGRTRFIGRLNERLAEAAAARRDLYLHDLNYLAASFGLERWYERGHWYSYKYALSVEAIPHLAHSLAGIVRAIYGRSRKCLVLDLDNTLWGGVIGDDGLHGIRLGRETAEAEAYTEFQGYLRELKERGVLLAVCSKNDPQNAREAFSHPDSVLKLEDFTAFCANWEPKHENIHAIAEQIGIGLESLVFVDDNPAEREIVRAQLPAVAVPEIGSDIVRYIDLLDRGGHFETVSLSEDDLQRIRYYADNASRQEQQSRFASYGEFLRSLEMRAEIAPFRPVYLDRITQLTNKTNQFNLTTRRYARTEIEALAASADHLCLYGRLTDKFGDNGLVSVVIGEVRGEELHLDLWLMSCRVLKRGMEQAMFDRVVCEARRRGVKTIIGYYLKTAKNAMVAELYGELGFERVESRQDGDSTWRLRLPETYEEQNQYIFVGGAA